MAGPAEPSDTSLRELAEKLVLAGLGLLSAAKEQAESFAGSPAEGPPLRERATAALASFLDELGFVRHERYEELELKVAQLEHRLRLLEQRPPGGGTGPE
jgi:hypothetical protein